MNGNDEKVQNEVDNEDDYLTQVGFMYDENLNKDCRIYEFDHDISVKLNFVEDNPGAVQSGHYVWPAAPAMAQYLVNHWMELPHGNTLELGSGCGLPGLVVSKLLQKTLSKSHYVFLSDYDPGCRSILETNVEQQDATTMVSCKVIDGQWGKPGKETFDKIKEMYQLQLGFELIIGSDVIYSSDIVYPLFETIHSLLHSTNDSCFLMCSSFFLDDETEKSIDEVCQQYKLDRQIITCNLKQGGVRIQKFRLKHCNK